MKTPLRDSNMNINRGLFRTTVVGCIIVGTIFVLFAQRPALEDFRWRAPTELERVEAREWEKNRNLSGDNKTESHNMKLLDVFLILQAGKAQKDHQKLLPLEFFLRYYLLPFVLGASSIWILYSIVRFVILGYVVKGFSSQTD